MPTKFNGHTVKHVKFNGKSVKNIIFKGKVVFTESATVNYMLYLKRDGVYEYNKVDVSLVDVNTLSDTDVITVSVRQSPYSEIKEEDPWKSFSLTKANPTASDEIKNYLRSLSPFYYWTQIKISYNGSEVTKNLATPPTREIPETYIKYEEGNISS